MSAYESRPPAMAWAICGAAAADVASVVAGTVAGVAAFGVADSPVQAAPPIKPAAPSPATHTRAARGVRRIKLFMVCNPLLD